MIYQLPLLTDEDDFERLVRDILRWVYDDPGIERFGRSGQSQGGIDGSSPGKSKITFQCKLKDTRYATDAQLQKTLATEMEKEVAKTAAIKDQLERFIFATTFKNDSALQEKADLLSSDSLIVEYWGWDTITERVWKNAEILIPVYFPRFSIRAIPGFQQITTKLIDRLKTDDEQKLKTLALEYYRINDRSELLLQVVANKIDIRNDSAMRAVERELSGIGPSGTLWLIGDGGSGKTTILHRIAVEFAEAKREVFLLDLEADLGRSDLESILRMLRYSSGSQSAVLCVDNPAADEDILETLLRELPNYTSSVQIIFSERIHRYKTLRKTDTVTYLHGEEEQRPIFLTNPVNQRQQVYDRLFELLGLSEGDKNLVRHIVLNEGLVYVNATYSILLELKKNRKIQFDFDWDDYRTATADLPVFREGYKFIALFYLFAVRTPFSVFSKICGANEGEQTRFIEKFGGLVNEPIVVDERRDDMSRRSIYLRTKHEIVSEIFFREHTSLDKNELLKQWAERIDFGNPVEAQSLVNIFGNKKNYERETTQIGLDEIIDFLLTGYIKEKVALSTKLEATLYLAKAWRLLFQDRTDEAVSALESILKIQPDNLHCRTELAKIYQREGKLEDAEYILREILQIDAQDYKSRTELAKVYQKQNRFADAEVVLLRLLELRPNDLNARTELSKVYQRQRQFELAESVLNDLLELDRGNIRAQTELAKVYQQQGKLDHAEVLLSTVLALKPLDLNARTELAKIYQRQGKLEQAEKLLLESLVIDDKQLHPRTELAKIYQRQGKLVEAETLLLQSLGIDHKQLHPRLELAKIYQRQNKLEQAIERLKEYLDLNPQGDQRLHPRTELAKIFQRQGKLDQAEAVLFELLALEPNDLQARTELAKIYQRQGKLAEAETLLLQSLEIDGKQLHPRTELAKIYQRQGKLHDAIRRLEEYIQLDPDGLHPRTELAKIYRRQGKLDEAARRGEEALQIDPLNDHAISELLATWQTQRKGEECSRRFLDFISQPRYRFTRSSQAPVFRFFQCCRQFGMKEKARVVFERFERDLDDRNLEYYRKTLA